MTPTSTELYHPDADRIELTQVLHALSDPIRLDLVRQLDQCRGERACGTFNLAIAKSTATHHWRVLRESGLVSARQDGTRKFHRLRRQDLDQRFPGLLDSILAQSDLPKCDLARCDLAPGPGRVGGPRKSFVR